MKISDIFEAKLARPFELKKETKDWLQTSIDVKNIPKHWDRDRVLEFQQYLLWVRRNEDILNEIFSDLESEWERHINDYEREYNELVASEYAYSNDEPEWRPLDEWDDKWFLKWSKPANEFEKSEDYDDEWFWKSYSMMKTYAFYNT